MYTAAVGETPVVPAYDYLKVTETIGELDAKISKIKHAINLANVTNEVQVGERFMSIDSVLVEMAQLNKRKEFLDYSMVYCCPLFCYSVILLSDMV